MDGKLFPVGVPSIQLWHCVSAQRSYSYSTVSHSLLHSLNTVMDKKNVHRSSRELFIIRHYKCYLTWRAHTHAHKHINTTQNKR